MLLSLLSIGQSVEIDSMKQLLPRQFGVTRLNTLLDLAYQLYGYSIDDAHRYALEALKEAKKNKIFGGCKNIIQINHHP